MKKREIIKILVEKTITELTGEGVLYFYAKKHKIESEELLVLSIEDFFVGLCKDCIDDEDRYTDFESEADARFLAYALDAQATVKLSVRTCREMARM